MKRFKLEFVDEKGNPIFPESKASWFDTQEEVDSHVELLKGCPVDDGPVRLRVTEFGQARSYTV